MGSGFALDKGRSWDGAGVFWVGKVSAYLEARFFPASGALHHRIA